MYLTHVLGTQKIHLNEMVIFEYPQHKFWLRNKKNNLFTNSYLETRSIMLTRLFTLETNNQNSRILPKNDDSFTFTQNFIVIGQFLVFTKFEWLHLF